MAFRNTVPDVDPEAVAVGPIPPESAVTVRLAPDGGLEWDDEKRLKASGGGAGAVTSVNGRTGAVVVTFDDVIQADNETSGNVVINSIDPGIALKLTSKVGDILQTVGAAGTPTTRWLTNGSVVYYGSAFINKNVQIGSDAVNHSSGTYVVGIQDYAAAPTTIAGGVQVYSDGGILTVLTGAGTTVKLTPSADSGNLVSVGTDKGILAKVPNGYVTLAMLNSAVTAKLITQQPAQADSTATDVAGLVADFNALLAKLRTAGVIAAT
jgi:hypothetical protein